MKKEDLTLEEILFLLKSKYESNNLKKIKSLKNKIDKMKESYDFELSKKKEISSRWKKAYLELNKNLYKLEIFLFESGKNNIKISKEEFLDIFYPNNKQDENIFIIHD